MYNDAESKKQIREKLGKLPVDDGKEVWADLEKLLEKKRSRKGAVWFQRNGFIVIILFSYITLSAYFLAFEGSSKSITVYTQQNAPYSIKGIPETQTTNNTTSVEGLKSNKKTQPVIQPRDSYQPPVPLDDHTEIPEDPSASRYQDLPNAVAEEALKEDPAPVPITDTTAKKTDSIGTVLAPSPTPLPSKRKPRHPYFSAGPGLIFNTYSFERFRPNNRIIAPTFNIEFAYPYGRRFHVAPFLNYSNLPSAIQVNYIDSPSINRYTIDAFHVLQFGLGNKVRVGYRTVLTAGFAYARILKWYSVTHYMTDIHVVGTPEMPRSKPGINRTIDPYLQHNDWNVSLGAEYAIRNFMISLRGMKGFHDITKTTSGKYILDSYSLSIYYKLPVYRIQ